MIQNIMKILLISGRSRWGQVRYHRTAQPGSNFHNIRQHGRACCSQCVAIWRVCISSKLSRHLKGSTTQRQGNFIFSTRHHKLVASTFTAFKLSLLYLISNDWVSWKQFISFVKTYALTFDPLLALYHEGDHLILRMCSLFIYLTHISYLFVL